MLYTKIIRHEKKVEGTREEYFQILTDVSRWYQWSPSIKNATLGGPFKEGAKGLIMPSRYSFCQLEIGPVIPNQKVTLIFKIPLSDLMIEYDLFNAEDGHIIIQRKSTLKGLTGWLVYVTRGRTILQDFDATLTALEKQLIKMRSRTMHYAV